MFKSSIEHFYIEISPFLCQNSKKFFFHYFLIFLNSLIWEIFLIDILVINSHCYKIKDERNRAKKKKKEKKKNTTRLRVEIPKEMLFAYKVFDVFSISNHFILVCSFIYYLVYIRVF